jgi:hypothetical protein
LSNPVLPQRMPSSRGSPTSFAHATPFVSALSSLVDRIT